MRQALYERAVLRCNANGVPSGCRVWWRGSLLAESAIDPELSHLCVVSNVRPDSVDAALELAIESLWAGAAPALLLAPSLGGALDERLTASGYAPTHSRVVAIRGLAALPEPDPELFVAPARTVDERALFVRVLLAGYGARGGVDALLSGEHSSPEVRGFLAYRRGVVTGAAAYSVHGDVAVLGGASTLPAFRGGGAQRALLAHRLRAALTEGCTTAVATAAPRSVSESNLARCGFTVLHCPKWSRA